MAQSNIAMAFQCFNTRNHPGIVCAAWSVNTGAGQKVQTSVQRVKLGNLTQLAGKNLMFWIRCWRLWRMMLESQNCNGPSFCEALWLWGISSRMQRQIYPHGCLWKWDIPWYTPQIATLNRNSDDKLINHQIKPSIFPGVLSGNHKKDNHVLSRTNRFWNLQGLSWSTSGCDPQLREGTQRSLRWRIFGGKNHPDPAEICCEKCVLFPKNQTQPIYTCDWSPREHYVTLCVFKKIHIGSLGFQTPT